MPRSNIIIRKPTSGAPSVAALVDGLAVSIGLGVIGRVASSRRVPVGVAATAQAGTISIPGAALGFGWQLTAAAVGLTPFGLVGTSLPVYSGANPIPSGSTVSNVRFTSQVDLSNGNIIIERCCFRPTSDPTNAIATTTNFAGGGNVPLNSAKVIIRDCEFDGTALTTQQQSHNAAFWGVADIQRCYIHHFGGGIAIYNAGTNLDALIEHNVVLFLTSFGDPATTGNHCDSFTIRDFRVDVVPGRTCIVRNNWFDCDTANATGACFIQDTFSTGIGNCTITGNLLTGGGYELVLEKRSAAVTNMVATNNRFGGAADGGYGAGYTTGVSWTTQNNNFIYAPSNPPNYAGAAVSF